MTDSSDDRTQAEPRIPTVSSLYLYPVKSCRRIEVQRVTVSDHGLVDDRRWQVSADGKPVTQRQKKILATVQPTLIDGGLRLTAPERGTIEVAIPAVADHETTTLVGGPAQVGDAGDEAAAWFGQVLEADDVRLHAMVDQPFTTPDALNRFSGTMAFPDLAPVLVANTSSLDWLVERAEEPFDIHRFRPNVVVTGADPFVEDTWSRFTIGAAEFTAGIGWPRCPIPQIDQDDGTRHTEPAKVLKAHRWCSDAPTLDGIYRPMVENNALFGLGSGIGPEGAVIAVGDRVTVAETQEPLIPTPTV